MPCQAPFCQREAKFEEKTEVAGEVEILLSCRRHVDPTNEVTAYSEKGSDVIVEVDR